MEMVTAASAIGSQSQHANIIAAAQPIRCVSPLARSPLPCMLLLGPGGFKLRVQAAKQAAPRTWTTFLLGWNLMSQGTLIG